MSSERQEYNEETPWWGEHIHRYQMVLPYLSQTGNILDIACGNGFGSFLLSKHTQGIVVGADISSKAVEGCKDRFKRENLLFKQMDGTALPYPENYFDIIVSFETIEHTTEYEKMLSEFNRVLKPGGTAFISTPNILVNSPGDKVTNPYHTQEFTFVELKALLEKNFSSVEISGQQYSRYVKHSFRNIIAFITEQILYLRGIRKIPLAIQNKIMQMFIGKDIYPVPEDFTLVTGEKEILKCKTFFAVCKKN